MTDYVHDPETCEVCQAGGVLAFNAIMDKKHPWKCGDRFVKDPAGLIQDTCRFCLHGRKSCQCDTPPLRDFNAALRATDPRWACVPTPGWLCVKCGRSYAPFQHECTACNAQVQP
jgi:hypothetical protein